MTQLSQFIIYYLITLFIIISVYLNQLIFSFDLAWWHHLEGFQRRERVLCDSFKTCKSKESCIKLLARTYFSPSHANCLVEFLDTSTWSGAEPCRGPSFHGPRRWSFAALREPGEHCQALVGMCVPVVNNQNQQRSLPQSPGAECLRLQSVMAPCGFIKRRPKTIPDTRLNILK